MGTDRARSSDEDARSEQRRATARKWRERNADRLRAAQKDWKARNPERARELNRESMRRQRERHIRISRQKAAANERASAWKQAHPEQARENQRRWREAHPERVREYHRRYYERHRDEIAVRTMRYRDANESAVENRRAEWAAANRERITEYQRKYREDPERYAKTLASNREARRVQRLLGASGLPPKRLHRVAAAERRANEADAHHFFTSDGVRQRYQQVANLQAMVEQIFSDDDGRLREQARARIGARYRAGLASGTVGEVALSLATAVAMAQCPTNRLDPTDVTQIIANIRELHHRRATAAQTRSLRNAIIRYVEQRVDWLRREAHTENRLRRAAGKPTIRTDVLAHHIAFHSVKDRLPLDQLRVADARRAVNAAREAHPTIFDDAKNRDRWPAEEGIALVCRD